MILNTIFLFLILNLALILYGCRHRFTIDDIKMAYDLFPDWAKRRRHL